MEHRNEHNSTPWRNNGSGYKFGNSSDKATLFLRLFVGALLFTQAITKSQQYPWLEGEYPAIGGLDAASVVSIVGIIEAISGAMLTIGLLTRPVSLLMAVVMFGAAFIFFPSQGFEEAELKVVYVGLYVTLAISGGGRYSLDNIIYGLRTRGKPML